MPGSWPQEVLLHDHGDGSSPLLPILQDLFKLAKLEFPLSPVRDSAELKIRVRRWFNNPNMGIVQRFSLTTGVLQNYESLILFAKRYTCERAREGYKYCEMTFAPQYHTYKGLREKDVISALIEGIRLGEKENPKIEVNILFSVGRETEPDEAVRLVDIAGECNRDYVVGIGLVCDEALHPPEKHKTMFLRAKELGFRTTCHAGEWVNAKPNLERDLPLLIKNVRTAIVELKVNRVDHAIGLAYDPELVRMVVDEHIGVAGCPGSNFDSGCIPDLECLRIRELLDAGVPYSMHPDDDLFLPDLEKTFMMCDKSYHFTSREKELLLQNAWLAKFGGRKQH